MIRFGAAVALALMAAGTVAGSAAAQDKKAEKPVPPKLSKPILAVVQAVQKLQQAGDHAGAVASLATAKDLPRVEKDDALIMAKLKIFSAQNLKDNVLLEEALTEAADAPSITPEEKLLFSKFIAGLASNRKDLQKAWKWYEFYLAQKPDDVDMIVQSASVNAGLNQRGKVVELLGRAIDIREKAGEKGDRSWYEFRAQAALDANLADQISPALMGWVKAFPEPKVYNTAIELVKQRSGSLDNNMLLDFSRLMWAAGAMTTASNYLEYSDAALDRGMPNEAEQALKEAIAKKLVDASKTNIAEFVKLAATKNAESRAGITGLEKDAKTSPRLALVVADTLVNLGQAERAIPFYKGLVGNAAVDQDTLNLRMGTALMKMGDKTGAGTAFDAVKAGPRQQIARFYKVLLGA